MTNSKSELRTLFAATAIMGVLACGDDDDNAAKSDASIPSTDGANLADANQEQACNADREIANFVVSPYPMADSGFIGYVYDVPYPSFTMETQREGECAYYGPLTAFCDPACTDGEICVATDQCRPYPTPVDAGTLSLTADGEEYSVASRNGYYSLQLPSVPQDAALALTGDSAATGPFAMTAQAVAPFASEWPQVQAVEHEDLTITWDSSAAPSSAQFILHFDNDHHGTRSYIECVAPHSAGTLTISSSILDRLIKDGESGIGTYIENAYYERRSSGYAEIKDGCARLSGSAQTFVSVETIRAR